MTSALSLQKPSPTRMIFIENERVIAQTPQLIGISYHFFCPVCARIWGRIVNPHGTNHTPRVINCVSHYNPVWFPPIFSQEFRYVELSYPKEVLARDFLIMMQLKSTTIKENNLP